jgi:hypothetical protein
LNGKIVHLIRVDPREVTFSVVKESGDGGDGASKAVFKHRAELR